MTGGYFGQQPFGGSFSESPDLSDSTNRILALVVSLYGASPTGPATSPRTASIPAFASAAVVAAFGSVALITERRTTVEDIWLTSP